MREDCTTDKSRHFEDKSRHSEDKRQGEITAWVFFLRFVPIESESTAWQALLEEILAQPQKYIASILTAAMERYSALIGEAGPRIMGDELVLGLPLVALQER